MQYSSIFFVLAAVSAAAVPANEKFDDLAGNGYVNGNHPAIATAHDGGSAENAFSSSSTNSSSPAVATNTTSNGASSVSLKYSLVVLAVAGLF